MPVAENKYTVSEVAERNGKDGAEVWFYIKDVVYDVTKFMNQVCRLITKSSIEFK